MLKLYNLNKEDFNDFLVQLGFFLLLIQKRISNKRFIILLNRNFPF